MLDRVRSFVNRLLDPDDRPLDADGTQIAAVALMCHVLAADGIVEDEEKAALKRIVAARFSLSDDATDALIEEATRIDREAVDLYEFTSTIKRDYDREARLSLVSAMWELIYADGGVHELEDNILWRVSELLGVDRRERIDLKLKASRRPAGEHGED
ncbi:tellurite resistance TerB family protein [Agaricicola taiwanensis]|nr:TerB family tellurite resistance protein [Agaricicola taiwanensis]